jgi:hypothetical protein
MAERRRKKAGCSNREEQGLRLAGEGGSKVVEVYVGWRRRLGMVWATVAEIAAPASPPTPTADKLRVGSIIIDTPLAD